MEGHPGLIAKISRFLHERLLWLLIGSYAVASVFPGPGLKARGLILGRFALFDAPVTLSVPMLMLSALLFNAGLGSPSDGCGAWPSARRASPRGWSPTC